jgi:hypothetical protein
LADLSGNRPIRRDLTERTNSLFQHPPGITAQPIDSARPYDATKTKS